MHRKVLIIVHNFPKHPKGTLRYRGLAKYLPEFGWEPVILTEVLIGKPDRRFSVKEVSYPGNVIKRVKRKLGLFQNKELQKPSSTGVVTREGKKSLRDQLGEFFWCIILDSSRAGLPAGTPDLAKGDITSTRTRT